MQLSLDDVDDIRFDPPPLGLVDPRSLDVRYRAWFRTDEAQEIIGKLRELNRQVLDRGFPHYSVYTLAHVVRWHLRLQHGPDASGFKVNDNYLSRLARWLTETYPDEFPPACRSCPRKGHDKAPKKYLETRRLRS